MLSHFFPDAPAHIVWMYGKWSEGGWNEAALKMCLEYCPCNTVDTFYLLTNKDNFLLEHCPPCLFFSAGLTKLKTLLGSKQEKNIEFQKC